MDDNINILLIRVWDEHETGLMTTGAVHNFQVRLSTMESIRCVLPQQQKMSLDKHLLYSLARMQTGLG